MEGRNKRAGKKKKDGCIENNRASETTFFVFFLWVTIVTSALVGVHILVIIMIIGNADILIS